MDDQERLALEHRIHSLLCGDLDPHARADVLGRVARDDEARHLLGEMLDMQQQARAACGLAVDAGAIQASVACVLAAGIPAERVPAGGKPRSYGPWVWRAAAAAAVAISVYVAVTASMTARRVEVQLAHVRRTLTMPRVTDSEVASYRTIWQHLGEGPGRSEPWVLLGEGTGQFGYVPAETDAKRPHGPLLVRCCLVTADGQVLETFNVLVPAGMHGRLVLPDAGRINDSPVHCEVATGGHATTLGILVGRDPGESVGVRGRVTVGGGPVELGQFRIDGATVHVILQAVPMAALLG